MGVHMSIPRGRTVVDGMETGVGNENVNAIPASVAKLMNGMVKISIPSEIWRRT